MICESCNTTLGDGWCRACDAEHDRRNLPETPRQNIAFSFEGGLLYVKADGSGLFQFDEADADFVPHDNRAGSYVQFKVAASEMAELRDLLIRALASHRPRKALVAELVRAAQDVLDETDKILAIDPPPIKWRAPYGTLARLRGVLRAFTSKTEIDPPETPEPRMAAILAEIAETAEAVEATEERTPMPDVAERFGVELGGEG